MLLGMLASQSQAQWAWAKSIGISGTTVWSAGAIGNNGDFYFGGVSDKLAGTQVRGFVMARYSDTIASKWSTKILGGSAAYAGETCLGVDSAGGSYLMDKFSITALTLPDTTQVTYTGACYFVSRYQPDGKLAWCKKLVVGRVLRFQVMSDGTLGIAANGIAKSYIFGNDTIPGSPTGSESYLIEVKPDGSIGRSFGTSDASAFTMFYFQWTEPGKVFTVGTDVASPGVYNYHRGMFALTAKTFTEDGTPLKMIAAPYGFRWEDNGFPNSPTTVMEPASGHIFALMSGVNDSPILNSTDTLIKQTNTQVKDGYVVELDAQMKVVRKVHLTNPLQLAVRDSQVAVTAIVRATSDFGFVTPDTTIKITLKTQNNDGLVLYVMDRNFKYKKHGLVEGTAQATLAPNAILLDANGGAYLSLQAGRDLNYQGLPSMSRGYVLGTMVSKLGIAPASLAHMAKGVEAQIRMEAGGRLILDRPGSYRYTLSTLKGEQVAAGKGMGRSVCDVSRAPLGMYLLTLKGSAGASSQLVRKLEQ